MNSKRCNNNLNTIKQHPNLHFFIGSDLLFPVYKPGHCSLYSLEKPLNYLTQNSYYKEKTR